MRKPLFYAVCDNIRGLQNIGSIFRTADGLRIDKIYLCGICGQPPQPKISKAALGAESWVPWEYSSQVWRLIEKLKAQGVFIAALEQAKNSLAYDKFQPKFPLALLVGNEVKGVSRAALKKADAVIHLPMLGRKESLNAAVAFGVVGYEISKFRKQ